MRERSEKTQPTNPRKLTRRQHVFPTRSIERFVENGGIDLFDINRGIRRRAKADDKMLWADRAWNQGAESGWMKKIEDRFQSLVIEMLEYPRDEFNLDETKIVAEFFALWLVRAQRRTLETQILRPHSTKGVRFQHSADDLEHLEKHGIIATRGDGSYAMRDINAVCIMRDLDRKMEAIQRFEWGILRAHDGEFCVPDIPSSAIIPVTPTLAFMLNVVSDTLTRKRVAFFNEVMWQDCCDYLFARDLGACPGLPPTSLSAN